MTKTCNYWLVQGEPALSVLAAFLEDVDRERKRIVEFVISRGGNGHIRYTNHKVISVFFADEKKVPKHWKRADGRGTCGYYRPRGNVPDGKADLAEMKQLRVFSGEDVGERFLGMPAVVENHAMYIPCLERIGDKQLVVGIESNQWKPIKGLKKLKSSEYWQMREKHALEVEKFDKEKKGKS
jgi:hypothetical protein